ncbi:GNAT family N-acetyltransferase [Methylorubrum extorquens]|uniref:GNAT family N-acetyltransferase n=1 Tax=Methylorubrum extorquens TaxID=408 RepID=UPI001EE58B11|nr:GNAT family N-acetyltransferase [Methylorubrum extorquens]MCG5247846.1 GNAT family N-acetyltransferase [Methylorubrum extorquens]
MNGSFTAISGVYVNLRPLSVEDADLTLQWRKAERARHLNLGAQSVEEQARWIQARPSSEYNYMIQLKSGAAVGMLSLVDIDKRNMRAETGRFLIGEEEQVKGRPVAVEAMGLLYDLAFNTLDLHRLYGLVAANNNLMIKWQKYLGMKEEGRLRDHYRSEDGFQDAVALGILKSEYESVFLPRSKALMAAGKPA